jgi:hypothetical protein
MVLEPGTGGLRGKQARSAQRATGQWIPAVDEQPPPMLRPVIEIVAPCERFMAAPNAVICDLAHRGWMSHTKGGCRTWPAVCEFDSECAATEVEPLGPRCGTWAAW